MLNLLGPTAPEHSWISNPDVDILDIIVSPPRILFLGRIAWASTFSCKGTNARTRMPHIYLLRQSSRNSWI